MSIDLQMAQGSKQLRRMTSRGDYKCYGVLDYSRRLLVFQRGKEQAVFSLEELGLEVKQKPV